VRWLNRAAAPTAARRADTDAARGLAEPRRISSDVADLLALEQPHATSRAGRSRVSASAPMMLAPTLAGSAPPSRAALTPRSAYTPRGSHTPRGAASPRGPFAAAVAPLMPRRPSGSMQQPALHTGRAAAGEGAAAAAAIVAGRPRGAAPAAAAPLADAERRSSAEAASTAPRDSLEEFRKLSVAASAGSCAASATATAARACCGGGGGGGGGGCCASASASQLGDERLGGVTAGPSWRGSAAHAAAASLPLLPPAPPPLGVLAQLPRAERSVRLTILSTWGDPHFVGLAGLELFDVSGALFVPSARELGRLRAEPADVNVLPGYGQDPRVVQNLFARADGDDGGGDDGGGGPSGCDESLMWLAPFTQGARHTVELLLDAPLTLAMARVWNYNKSRAHSFRGARLIELECDDVLVFAGEVNKAPGNARDAAAAAEVVLFTTDETTLARVEACDPVALQAAALDALDAAAAAALADPESRPRTAGRADDGGEGRGAPATPPDARSSLRPSASDVPAELLTAARPQTNATRRPPQPQPRPQPPSAASAASARRGSDSLAAGSRSGVAGGLALGVHRAVLEEVGGGNGGGSARRASAEARRGDAPRAHAHSRCARRRAEGGESDGGASDASLDMGDAQDDDDEGSDGSEARGALGGLPAPADGASAGGAGDYVLPRLPLGQRLELRLLCTWGDRHYVGLNGVALFDEDGAQIALAADAVSAEPHSINVLADIRDDPRTPDKLVDGFTATRDDTHMWLAPWSAGETVSVCIELPAARRLSCVRLWNYGKTPSRGAKQLELLLDGTLVYAGYVRAAPPQRDDADADAELVRAARGRSGAQRLRARWRERCALADSLPPSLLACSPAPPPAPPPLPPCLASHRPLCAQDWCQSLVLTDEPAIVERERAFVCTTGARTHAARAHAARVHERTRARTRARVRAHTLVYALSRSLSRAHTHARTHTLARLLAWRALAVNAPSALAASTSPPPLSPLPPSRLQSRLPSRPSSSTTAGSSAAPPQPSSRGRTRARSAQASAYRRPSARRTATAARRCRRRPARPRRCLARLRRPPPTAPRRSGAKGRRARRVARRRSCSCRRATRARVCRAACRPRLCSRPAAQAPRRRARRHAEVAAAIVHDWRLVCSFVIYRVAPPALLY
jgi:hypothetical protein